MRSNRHFLFLFVSALLIATIGLPIKDAFAIGFEILKPHRAVYDIKLVESSERSAIDGLVGRIVYEVKGNACEGISVKDRFVTRITSDGRNIISDTRTTSHESPDGAHMDFTVNSFIGDRLDSTLKGAASQQGKKALLIELEKPHQREIKTGYAVFSSMHVVKALEKAGQGERFFKLPVYYANEDGDKIMNTANLVGKPRIYDKVFSQEDEKAVADLRTRKAWPVSISYFSVNSGAQRADTLPEYEMSFLLYDDGVTRRIKMLYPDYTLSAQLVDLEYFKQEACK